jgi:peptide/nickel transport system substrate-binding protein
LNAFPDHYLGRPTVDEIVVSHYPSIRAAWAEMLRGNVDILWEVGIDALDSLEAATNVSVFTVARPYQYQVMFGSRMSKSSAVRRALNAAIDRRALVRNVLRGHGIPSTGPVSPRHWAVGPDMPRLEFDPALATRLAGPNLQFKCLVSADSVYERMALELKRQLAAVSIDMIVEEASQERLSQALKDGDFETLLADVISGPTLLRLHMVWHSQGVLHTPGTGSVAIDGALDRVRHAISEDEYRAGVNDLQRAVMNDPPAIFLAWSERARAVSRRFTVPAGSGRDVLASIQFWRPSSDPKYARLH